MQSWVSKSVARSVVDEPASMQAAAENKKKIMGSSLFGDDGRPPPQMHPVAQSTVSQPPQNSFSRTMPAPIANADSVSYENNFNFSSQSNNSYGLNTTMPMTFPDINFETVQPPSIELMDFGFRHRNNNLATRQVNPRRLEVPPNTQMRELRDELNRDTERFNQKLRKIGQI